MRQIMCVHLRQWAIDRFRRRTRMTRRCASGREAVVLIETIGTRQVVRVASEEAQAGGVREGMTLAQARALCPEIVQGSFTPGKDLQGLEGLARWMMRFSPVVAISGDAEQDHRTPYLPAVFVDVTGCERVFGGLANLIEQVDQAMRTMHVRARIAVAPTLGAAWAVALAGRENGQVVRGDKIARAIAPLPAVALRIEAEMAKALYHLGIETIGQLMQLPRNALPARFGPMLLKRLDQALGRIAEPLLPLTCQSPIEARMDFEGVVDSLEAIWMVFKNLLSQVIKELARRGCGARQMELEFLRSDAPPIRRTIALSRPSRDPVGMFNLMRCAMEGMEEHTQRRSDRATKRQRGKSLLARAVTNGESMVPAGFVGIRVGVPIFEKVSDEQISLLEQEEHDGRVELDHLIERLVLRLGDEGIVRARLVESYVPEKAYALVRQADWTGGPGPEMTAGLARTRPLCLLKCPVEIGVMVSPSHDRDGRPISFTHEGEVHRVMHAIGPERIGGQWWEGHNKTRDYFVVEDESGRRSWVFRVRETDKWYLHGEFE
ncbi:MAG TPA: DNA polymerase Y family protein [Tepidisphaeraceae bacterium]|nr:DNA polymerase Y family protein [Tepidisphaeraceae bacterium]